MRVDVSYDPEADAAYISLVGVIEPGEATSQVSFIETPNGESLVTLDFDANGYLLGIEVLFASLALQSEVLDEAKQA